MANSHERLGKNIENFIQMTTKHNHKITYDDGREYVGEFKKGVLHGQGTESSPDGTKV